MELVYAALLLHKSGKEITSDSLKKIMEAAGAQADDSKVRALVAALDGVDIDQAIKEVVATSTAPAAEANTEKASEEKSEEKSEEDKKKEEAKSAAGLGALFG